MVGKETVTPRERVLKALNFQEPDRVPIDLGGFQTGIHKRAYEDLLQYLGLEEEIEILDPVQQLAKPSEEVLQRFHVDTRYITAHAPQNPAFCEALLDQTLKFWMDYATALWELWAILWMW